jgi:hypothetical protein
MNVSRTPAPSTRAILAEVGGAIVGGLVMAPLLALLVSPFFRGMGMGLLSIQVFAAVAGFGIGAGVGAALAGRAMDQRGTWWLGSLLGVLTAAVVILVLRLLNINVGGLFGILYVGVPLTLAAAVVGYNLRRHP